MKKNNSQNKKYLQLRERKQNMSDLIFRRIVHLLSTGEYEIVISSKTGHEAGFIDFENDTIYLNPKMFPIAYIKALTTRCVGFQIRKIEPTYS